MTAAHGQEDRSRQGDGAGLDPGARATRLRVFGVGPHAEQVYRLILRNGGDTPESISDLVGRPLPEVVREVDRLVELRLARRVDQAVRPEPPDLALGRLVGEHQERLQVEDQALSAVRASISQYVLDHESGREGDWDPVVVDAIDVTDLVGTMETLVLNSTGDLRFMRPDQWSLPSGLRMDRIVMAALETGRVSRALYPDVLRDDVPDAVQIRAEAGEQVRVLPQLPVRLAIFGTAAAILPEHFDRTEGRRLVIRHPALVRGLCDLFDLHWSRGVAVPGLEVTSVADESRQLLQMLAGGAKDEQMARAMGLSLRTVRRRVATLLVELGVQSRFQAGVEAVRRGWL